MLLNGVARALIKNIPMEMGGIEIIPCKADFLGLTDFPPADLSCWFCDFNDDTWDARKAFRMQWRSENIIRFGQCDERAKYAVKCFVAKCLDNKIKFSTMHSNTRYLIRVINDALQRCPEGKMVLVTADNILDSMRGCFKDIYSQLYSMQVVKKFVQFVREEMYGFPLVDMVKLNHEILLLSDIASLHHNQKHYQPIPEELFNGLMTMFYDVMHDEDAPLNDRLTSGIMLIDTQLGIRKSEICALETDFLGYHFCDTGVNEPFITYNCIKASRGDLEVVPIQTWCTALCEQTAKEYLELRQRCIYANETDFLYVLDPRNSPRDGTFPVSPQTLATLYSRLCAKYAMDIISRDWKGVNRVNVMGAGYMGKFSIPPIHCYRTTVASMAAVQGLPYDYIECALSHDPNSEMGLGYYGGVPTPWETPGPIQVPQEHINAFDDFINNLKTANN